MSSKSSTSEQLQEYGETHKESNDILKTSVGCPIADKKNSKTAGKRGPLLIEDFVFQDEMAHFDHERIPERVVHAKGAGAIGYFECTHDVTRYTKLKPFEKVGKQTPLAIRFSTVGAESGSADTVRDPRGFAIKFYTEDGNWDLVGNNTPIFFIRDPIFFPSFIHSQKRNPVTHLKDPDAFWDFITLRPETTHQVMILFSDRGIPDGHRHMHGFGSHAFKLINKDNEIVYCKFHHKTNQGIRNLPVEKARNIAATDPDYGIRDLYNAISSGNYPSWTVNLQIMTQTEADRFPFNPFDVTKVWPHAQFPLIPVGRIVLNRNPTNYFAQVEQLAFCPAHFIPGVAASPDKMLHGRIFSYTDTQRHRLGPNNHQIPVNCPYRATKVANYQRDGPMCVTDNQDGAPNYYPNSFSGPQETNYAREPGYPVMGEAARYETANDDNFTQPGIFYSKVLEEPERARLVANIAGHLTNAKQFIQERAVTNFSHVDPDMGQRLKAALNELKGKL